VCGNCYCDLRHVSSTSVVEGIFPHTELWAGLCCVCVQTCVMFVFHLLCVVSNCKFDVIRWSKPYFRLIGGTDVAGLDASQVEPVLVT